MNANSEVTSCCLAQLSSSSLGLINVLREGRKIDTRCVGNKFIREPKSALPLSIYDATARDAINHRLYLVYVFRRRKTPGVVFAPNDLTGIQSQYSAQHVKPFDHVHHISPRLWTLTNDGQNVNIMPITQQQFFRR